MNQMPQTAAETAETAETAIRYLHDRWDHIQKEEAYKVPGAERAREVITRFLEGQADAQELARSFHRNLNILGWRSADKLRGLMRRHPEAFREAIRLLWQTGDADGFWSVLESRLSDPEAQDELQALGGKGGQANIASYFLFVHDPHNHPPYKLRGIANGLAVLGHRAPQGDTPGGLLRDYYAILRELLPRWQEAGIPVRHLLDVQSGLWHLPALVAGVGAEGSTEAQERQSHGTASPAHAFDDLQAYLRSCGLAFTRAQLAHCLAALQTKRLLILSGLSGTGKTQLALRVGEYLGEAVVIPVKPDWTDTRGVLGYVNPLSGDYQLTPALRFILQAARQPDLPHFLILDEMNLAHVERYFADFLSALESGEPIPLHLSADVERQQGIPSSLRLPENLWVIGTVNVDETTYAFSPKVLDRAFVIELNDVDLAGYLNGALEGPQPDEPVDEGLRLEARRDWRGLGVAPEDREWLLEVHRNFSAHQWPFGYRVADEVLAFLSHARRLRVEDWNPRDAALSSKLLPRLHGNRAQLEGLLQGLAGWLGLDLEDPDAATPYPTTAGQLRRLWLQLQHEGYAAALG
ncbi:McrB family protein [Calidithermus roseus]|uniref:5-methylcytosine-specific restriction enzyme B n=1 Tax=Calidithermus roseus TaxID=1644118 RepID=A0A399ETQ6_9DEIN|nr:hypothetical protein [Calidithermus roseus]RIH86876.1 5-methylcytosine-specific restriction enzyme B [Calidithermus roseus]